MISVKDVKPSLGVIKTAKPKILTIDVKPTLFFIGKEQTTYIDNIMAYKGQSIGLLLSLTYPVDTIIGKTTRL